jgi:hypothetical protein
MFASSNRLPVPCTFFQSAPTWKANVIFPLLNEFLSAMRTLPQRSYSETTIFALLVELIRRLHAAPHAARMLAKSIVARVAVASPRAVFIHSLNSSL